MEERVPPGKLTSRDRSKNEWGVSPQLPHGAAVPLVIIGHILHTNAADLLEKRKRTKSLKRKEKEKEREEKKRRTALGEKTQPVLLGFNLLNQISV